MHIIIAGVHIIICTEIDTELEFLEWNLLFVSSKTWKTNLCSLRVHDHSYAHQWCAPFPLPIALALLWHLPRTFCCYIFTSACMENGKSWFRIPVVWNNISQWCVPNCPYDQQVWWVYYLWLISFLIPIYVFFQEVGSIIGKKGEIVKKFREEVRKYWCLS